MTRVIELSPSLWVATVGFFDSYWRQGVEAGCYWYASPGEVAAVRGIGIPRQQNWPRRFDVGADELAALNEAMPEELVAVAQVHSHPEDWTDLSPWDVERMVSRRALAVVVPRYGHHQSLAACGIHAYSDGAWRKQAGEELAGRVHLAADGPRPLVIDLR